MASYVNLLAPLKVPVIPPPFSGFRTKNRAAPRPGWMTGALLACLVLGVAIAVVGWPPPVMAGEAPPQRASEQADRTQHDASAQPGAAAEPPAAPNEAEPTSERDAAAETKAAPPAAEAEQEAEQAEPAEAEQTGPGLETLSGKSLFALLQDAKGTLSVLDLHKEQTRIERGLARNSFSVFLWIVSLAVLIGPFYLALRFTKDWRQPLWGWPIGLLLFAVLGVAAVLLIRMALGALPDAYGYEFLRFLVHIVLLRNFWITVALIAVSIWLGAYLSRKWRMPEYSGRITVVSFSVLTGLVITVLGWSDIKLGIDLRGGVILVYEFEGKPGGGPEEEGDREKQQTEKKEDAPSAADVDMDKLIQAIRLRVDPSNIRELTIRPYGERQIEVIIPEADEEERARIKKKISSAGTLEFRILANRRDSQPGGKHPSVDINRAMQLEGRELKDSEGNLLAWWVPVRKGEEEGLLRFADRAETVYRKRTYGGYEWTEFLVVKDIFDVNGGYLVSARTGIDQSGRPNVLFTFSQRGGSLFLALTTKYRPDEAQDFSRHLGIILDGYLQSAPAIKSPIAQQGEITGDFTRQEVEDLVDILNAGSLPTALSEEPISELFMGPELGQDTIDRGKIAIVVSMLLVVAFMLVYYRFAGLVACLALMVNLVMIVAIMISVRAAFTLPGLAGLVLTVGMAVDANVLIFERIREELSRQATLRMAIRNGFARATTTIVDANLTTLITATVLYVIGTDQIKGFAVILWLGVVLSMFTAIYCSRLVFDVAEKQKWITQMTMLQILGKTQIDFLGKRRVAVAGSIVVIVIGLAGVVGRGSGMLDIDFIGGVSIETVFNEPQDIANIRAKLGEEGEGLRDLAVSDVQTLDEKESGRRFVINTSGLRDMSPDIESEEILAEVKQHIENAFGDALAHYRVTVTMLPSDASLPKAVEAPAKPPAGTGSHGLPPASMLASTDPSAVLLAQAESSAEAPAPAEGHAEESREEAPPADAADESPYQTRAQLTFEHKITHESLKRRFDRAIKEQQEAGLLEKGPVDFELSNEEYLTVDINAPYAEWEVTLDLPPEEGEALLLAVEKRLESQVYFPPWSNTVGAKVVGKTRVDAIAALLASLVFIVGYIWIRFQRVMFGLAAVVALVHDVLVTLGVIALTAYVVSAGEFLASFIRVPLHEFLLLDEFKIGLPVLAAFLTIVGYSLNDTIVVFDRIREVRGKAPQLTVQMVNDSINQTLSRTLLTSLTTLLVVVVLYIGGGQGIHVFSFALVVGVLVGTYSSIFVASPILLWMARPPRSVQKTKGPRRGG